jgi:hypothetical protein
MSDRSDHCRAAVNGHEPLDSKPVLYIGLTPVNPAGGSNTAAMARVMVLLVTVPVWHPTEIIAGDQKFSSIQTLPSQVFALNARCRPSRDKRRYQSHWFLPRFRST